MKKWWLIFTPVAIFVVILAVILNNSINTSNNPTDISSLNIDNGDLNIDWPKYGEKTITLEKTLTITESGTYNIYGSLEDDNIIINVPNGKVKLILNNVSIKNSSGPAISCYAADDLVIELVGENYLEDGKTHASNLDEDVNGVIYSKADLILQGEGSLALTSHYQDGIVSKDDLTIRGGTYDITSVDDAIRGKDSVHIAGGNIDIKSVSDGIKSTSNSEAGKGFVYIESGSINIEAGDDGIHAETSLIIDDGNIKIAKSYEGLEGKIITINDGTIYTKSSDDGINAGNGTSESNTPRPGGMMDADENCILTINNGDIYVNAGGDGIDSNGYVYINGGRIVVDGPTNNGNGALDSGLGIIINGGEALAIGSSGMAEKFSQKSSISSISINLSSMADAGSKIELKDSSGNIIFEHTSAKRFSNITAASPKLTDSGTYILYIDGEPTKTLCYNNKKEVPCN
ncbi:carbohydrate-binding domain-containing protein [Candidatus Saccharibacteria bacterium]|nr:carbohydrate-binding domain-containing protein [Candidatus Saccharibacteria bacterium]